MSGGSVSLRFTSIQGVLNRSSVCFVLVVLCSFLFVVFCVLFALFRDLLNSLLPITARLEAPARAAFFHKSTGQ